MPRGRKTEGPVAKMAPLNMRTTPYLRERIEAAADSSGLSLTQEVERRLMTSFIFDDARGGAHIHAFAQMISASIQNIELQTGHRWMDDFDTFTQVRGAVDRLLRWRNPGAEEAPVLDEVEDRAEKALADRMDAAEKLDAFRAPHQKSRKRGSGLFGAAIPIIDRSAWSDAQHAEEADLLRAADDAWREWMKVDREANALREKVSARIEASERAGETVADAVFESIYSKE